MSGLEMCMECVVELESEPVVPGKPEQAMKTDMETEVE